MRAIGWIVAGVVLASTPVEAQRPNAARIEQGRAVFTGQGNCWSCHGRDGRGGQLAPDLTDRQWLNIDGSAAAIERIVRTGVAAPKEHPAPMPAMGGARLTEEQVGAVATYVFTLSQGGVDNEAIRAMRRSLLDLASQQELYRAQSKRYTASLSDLSYAASGGASVRILSGDAAGWAGSATHGDLPGKSCVVYFGKVSAPSTAGGLTATRAAAVTCDAP